MNRSEFFAANIKAQRRKRKMTQKEFADILGYSEKAVSKWECGSGIPPIETLFEIARLFDTSIDGLFCADERYYLAIDGGGTKTALLLADKDGKVIRSHRAPACNPVDVGFDKACEVLSTAIKEICGDIPLSEIILFAGIAGGTIAGMRERLQGFFEVLGFCAFENDSDNKNIIAAGLGDADGISLILGTGICAFVRKCGEYSRIAGWGYLVDAGGSGYNLGQDALNAYFSACDGSGEPTLISEEVDALHEGGTDAIMSYIYSEKKKAVASFAPAIYKALERGDETAKRILERNMKVAANVAETARKSFPDKKVVPLVISGGLTDNPETLAYFRAALKDPDEFDIKILDRAPVYGALELAMKIKESERENA